MAAEQLLQAARHQASIIAQATNRRPCQAVFCQVRRFSSQQQRAIEGEGQAIEP